MQRNVARPGILLLAAFAVAGVTHASPAFAAAPEPIRVGFIGPLTGLFAQAGKDMLDGLRLYFEQAGFQAGGRKIELIEEDDEGNPASAVAKYRKLVERDRIHVLAGVLLSNIAYGLHPMIERDGVPSLYLSTPDDLTKRRPAKWIARLNYSGSQPTHPLGDYAYKTLGYRRAITIGQDNQFGYEQLGGFQKVFEDLGGRVIQKIWVPLNAQDFAPYITQFRRDTDVVVSVFTAGQAVRFLKQYAEYGLKGKIPLIGSGVTSEDSVLRAVGDAADGYLGALIWASTLPNPANQAFVRDFTAKFGRPPSYFSAVMYGGARWLVEGANRINGAVEDKERFLQAIRQAAQGEDIRGPIALDDLNNPTQNVYILKVQKVGDKHQNTVVHTYPMVSQFWTFKPEEFLKEPVYTRDYPPVKP